MRMRALLGAAALTCTLAAAGTAAAAPVFTPSPNPLLVIFAGCSTFTCGFSFTANSNSTVTQLGIYDDVGPGAAPGFASPVSAGLWTATGTLLASISLSGTGGTLIGSYRYSNITAVNLTAGSSYVLAAFGDDFYDEANAVTLDTSIISITAGLFRPNSFGFPTLPNRVIFGANMFLEVPRAVPEPGSLALLSLAALGLLATTRRKRQS